MKIGNQILQQSCETWNKWVISPYNILVIPGKWVVRVYNSLVIPGKWVIAFYNSFLKPGKGVIIFYSNCLLKHGEWIIIFYNILLKSGKWAINFKTCKQLCFRHVSESRFFLLGALYRSKFAKLRDDSMQKHLSYLPMHKKFHSSHWFLKNQIFSLFATEKMNANYAEIRRVDNLEAAFQQVSLVRFF